MINKNTVGWRHVRYFYLFLAGVALSVVLYRVIKKSLWTWWLQYRKLQVMFKVSPASLQTFIDMPNCVLEDCVQYSTVHIPNVFCDGYIQLIICVGIVQIHWVGTLVSGNCAWNRCWTSCVYSPPHRNTCSTRNVRSSTDNIIISTHVSCLTTWLNLTVRQLTARARGTLDSH